jgi:hypothetical protein
MGDFVPYYPSRRYIDQNLAPEKIPLQALQALAQAQRAATKGGVMSPYVAQRFLPNALTEGRFDDFGVNGLPLTPTPRATRTLQRLGLSVGKMPDYSDNQITTVQNPFTPMTQEQLAQMAAQEEAAAKQRLANPPPRPKEDVLIDPSGCTTDEECMAQDDNAAVGHPVYTINNDAPHIRARIAAAVLADKARMFGDQNAIARWNGNGRVVNSSTGKVIADSNNHAAKVEALLGLLSDPRNAKLMQTYQGLLAGD